MADASQSTDDVGTHSQITHNALLKRNPHVRSSEMSSPAGFGGLGTRQFLQKQLMTPGSATSASSFEEGASYDGFSDAGTPGTDFQVKSSHVTVSKQPTKRLSSPSRESLSRRLMAGESGKAETLEGELLTNLVVKRVPNVTRTVRRVVRRTGADGQVTEQVQIVDVDGNVVEELPSTVVSSKVVTPVKLTKRNVRRTGADGKVREQVQYLDVEGNVVKTEGAAGDSLSSSLVTPGKTIRRVIVRRTGADGQVLEEVQSVDADGNVVSDGSNSSSFTNVSDAGSGRTVVTRRVVSPGQTLKKVRIRTKGADGEMREEVQYVDADGNVVSTGGSDLSKSGSFTTEETITREGSSTPGRRKVTRRIVRRMLVRKDGTRVPVEQYLDSDGQVIESEDGTLARTDSFSSANDASSSSRRRTITRRVVTSPVVRTVVHTAGSTSGAESEDEVLFVDAEGDLGSSRSASSQSTAGRKVITRRVVTPQRVVRRMVVRKGTTSMRSSTAVEVDGLDIDAESVETEGASSDESANGSSRGVSEVKTSTSTVTSRSSATKAHNDSAVEAVDEEEEPRKVSGMTVASTRKNGEDYHITPEEGVSVKEPSVVAVEAARSEEAVPPKGGYWVHDAGVNYHYDSDGEPDKPNNPIERQVVATSEDSLVTSNPVVGNEVTHKAHQPSAVETTTATALELSRDDEDEREISTGPLDVPVAAGTAVTAATIDAKASHEREVPSETTARSEEAAFPKGGYWVHHEGGNYHYDSDGEPDKPNNLIERQVVPSSDDSLVASSPVVEDEAVHEAGHPSDDDEFETPQTPLDVSEKETKEEPAETTVATDESTFETNSNTVQGSKSPHHERRSSGGFWGFFGKSEEEPKETVVEHGDVKSSTTQQETKQLLPADEETNAREAAMSSTIELPTGEKGVASTAFVEEDVAGGEPSTTKPQEVEEESRGGFWGFFGKSEDKQHEVPASDDSDEDKAPVAVDEDVQGDVIDVSEPKMAVESPHATPKSQTDNDVVRTAAVVMAMVNEKPTDHSPKPEIVEEIVKEGVVPVTVVSPTAARLEVPAIQTTTVTTTTIEEESESPTKISQRKTGRSIWKFWGADTPNGSPSRIKTEDEEREVHPVAVPHTTTTVATTEQIETPATEKTFSPVARGQGAVVESPRGNEYTLTNEAVAGDVVVTEITQTNVTTEEFDCEHRHTVAAPATIEDITMVAESQQPIEREIVELKDDKPSAGFWGFMGKKDKREQPAATATVDDISVEREEKADVSAVVQVESIRRSIPSEGTPTNAASVVQSEKLVRNSERRTTELTDGVEPDSELDEHYVPIASPRNGGGVLNEGGEWSVTPCSLAWNNLRLNCKNWTSSPLPTGSNDVLLNGVSGSLQAGEFLVITGPSKDESLALLSCLAGYEDAMEGNVTVNGRAWNEKMKRYIAYVMREDLFYETLTVHEHLVAQAQLRMKRSHNDELCLARVERVINDMGLSNCRDKLIGGGVSLRGITRGERKLLAIATALLTNPSILLVEEPTDGLDTFSAEKVVAKLRWLAFEKGLTVAVTLHHPSSHFYGLFDVLYLVADASCVYDGKASDCVAYFSTIGYHCPEYMSPMDYFMLQMATGDRDTDDVGVARVEMLKREWTERNGAVYADNAARAAAASEDSVVDDYDKKNSYRHMSCCGQLWLLWARHVRRLSRYGFVFWWHLLAALLIGVVFGLVYLQLDLNDQHGIQNFAGAFFYIVVVQMLFIAYRTFVFMPRETAIALRERQEYRGGWFHLLCWYFTKIVAELPALIVLSIALFVPVFLLVGIGHGFKVYVYMQIVVVLAGWAAVGLAFLTLGVLRHVTLALIIYAALLILFVVFGGLLINVTDIPDWLVWLHYISPIKYGYEALMKVFWKRVDSIDCDWTLEGCVALTGDGVLKYYSMENRSALGDSLILLAICFALLFVAFWFLLALSNKRVSGLQWRYDWSFKGPLGRRQQRVGNATVGDKQGATRNSMQRFVERASAAVERSTAADGENYYIHVETPRVGGQGVCDAVSVTLGWSSLWLRATTDKKMKVDEKNQHQKYLLSDTSGSAKCGELVLITGPSDESNVALLESLGGKQKKLRGKVTLNGVASSPQKVAECAAYVTRDDLFYETLTVEEHLRFQAQLVVDNSTGGCGLCCGGAGDLETERVEMVLDELELTAQRHMLIRYLSTADVKLVAIATSLLTNPSILLVEEPTCGMDFYSSQRVVLKLRQLARGGRTVVVTMTHPSSHLYALFDSLYLLADGAAVYHGKVRKAVSYFASLGYQCPQYMSPVDFFIRQVSLRNKEGEPPANGQAKLFTEAWSTRYSELCIAGENEDQEMQEAATAHRRRVGCCSQLSLLFRRHILRLARYRAVFGWHAFWMIVLGVIFGLVFLQLDLDDQQDIQNWAGAFFFLIVLQMLVVAYRTFVFLPREMAIAEREHRSGGYYMICWYLTKMFAELPAMMVLSVLLFVPAYLLIGIGHGFKVYFYMQLVMWLAGWGAAGMASLLLGLFRRVRVALVVYMLLLILFVVFGGLLVNVDDVPDYLIWLHYISPVKYGYEALMKLFWGRIAFLACGDSDGSGSGIATFATVGDDYSFSMSGSGSYEDDDCIAHSGGEVLSHYSMQTSRSARSDSFILLELTVLYFFIGYAFLSLRWRRYKTRQQRYSTPNNIDN